MIRIESVKKLYRKNGNSLTALDCPLLEVEAGEFIAVVGESGSVKTTLLSVMGGMLAPSSGKVWVDQQSLYDLSVSQRSRLRNQTFGFVFQNFNLVPYLTALENVQIPLHLAGQSRAVQQAKAQELLDRVGLADRVHHRPAELSAGQQQRVAIARTLANDPALILADEPTGNLDPTTRAHVLTLFREFQEEGRAIVMVTHDPVAAEHAQRSVRLENGALSLECERDTVLVA